MQLRTINFLLVLVTGRVGSGGEGDKGKWHKLWDCEEGLCFVYDHFVKNMKNEITNDNMKEVLSTVLDKLL